MPTSTPVEASYERAAFVFNRLEAGESIALLPPDFAVSAPPLPDIPSLGVCSSGTSGVPKLVWRPWAELRANLATAALGRIWASPFHPWTFAGAQVAAQAWRDGTLVRGLHGDAASSLRMLKAGGVTALSCTPTFLQILLLNEPLVVGGWGLNHVTLGGEPLPAALGSRLRNIFPGAKFRSIYASAEHGLLLKTSRLDGWYETAPLSKRRRWRVEGGQLEIWRDDAFVGTGDRVELKHGLVRVLGRMDDVANVGGVKVSLAEVRAVAEEVAGVAEASAQAVENPVTGQVVKLRFSLLAGHEEGPTLEQLQTHLRSTLPKPAWPRVWEVGPPALGGNAKQSTK